MPSCWEMQCLVLVLDKQSLPVYLIFNLEITEGNI